jgi:hypothetical protein
VRTGLTTVIGRSTASVADFGLVDAAQRIGIVLDVAFNGVHAFKLFQLFGCHMGHRGSLRSTDQGISMEVGVARVLLFWVL